MSYWKYGVSRLKWRSVMSECFWVPPLGSFLTVFLSEITTRLFTLCNEPLLYLRTPKSATMIKCLIDYVISSVDLFLQSLPGQARLFKLLKLQSYYYVDLEESIGTVETTKQVYNQILELCIANTQV